MCVCVCVLRLGGGQHHARVVGVVVGVVVVAGHKMSRAERLLCSEGLKAAAASFLQARWGQGVGE